MWQKLGDKQKFIIQLLLVFIISFAFFGFIQFSAPNLVGTDGFYHIKYSYLLRTDGFSRDFPWWQTSIFVNGFADEYFFYHLLLIPFTFLELIFAAKLSAVFFASLMTVVFYFVLKRLNVRYALFWTILLPLASSKFLYRLNFSRAITLSITLLLLYYHFLKNENYLAQFVTAFLFAWSFPAFYFILLVLGAYAIGNLFEKRSCKKAILFGIAGLIAGFVINPYFPNNILVAYTHSLHMLYNIFAGITLAAGTEMKPPVLAELVRNSFIVFLLFAFSSAVYLKNRKKDKNEFTAAFIISASFIVLGFFMVRAVDYFAPFTALFAALMASRYLKIDFPYYEKALSKNQKKILILIGITILFVFLFLSNNRFRYDEKHHYYQISLFLGDEPGIHSYLSMIPGYHALMAAVAWLVGESSKEFIRGASLLFSLISVLVFFLITRVVDRKNSAVATLEYLFFPPVFALMFLIYTDVFSLSFILLAFYLVLRKRYRLAGFVGLLSLLVRQNSVVWLGFMSAVIYYENFRFKFSLKNTKKYLKMAWVFMLSFALFAVFVVINKGFAVGDKEMHPAFSFHTGNIMLFLFLFFFFFLPSNLANFSKVIGFIKKRKAVFVASALLLFAMAMTFVNDHPYNQKNDLLRNILMNALASSTLLKAVFFVFILCGFLSLVVAEMHRKSFYFIYPFGLIVLALTWIIDLRYQIPLFGFILLFRKKMASRIEYLQLAIYIAISLIFIYLIAKTRYFL